jgi:hypothetical protein
MSMIAQAPSRNFLPAVWKLIRLRLQIIFNGFKHARTIRKILTIVAGFSLLAFAGMILFLSWLLLNFLRSPQLTQYVGMDVTPFLQAMPVLIFTTLFMGILLSSFGVLLQALYLSGDMDFLLSSPVPIRAVFVTKLLQAVLPNFGLIALFGLPVLYGLGLAGHYNLLYAGSRRSLGTAGHAGGARLPGPAGGGNPGFHRSHPGLHLLAGRESFQLFWKFHRCLRRSSEQYVHSYDAF